MEIVTHPATLPYHLKKFPWNEIIDRCKAEGYRSHNTTTCGIHVHVSRDALGRNDKSQELTISKLLVILWRHWAEIWKFSRRTNDYFSRQQYSEDKLTRSGLHNAKNQGRYTALNLLNYGTVEFRLFRGTLNLDTFKAILQFVDVLVTVALENGIGWIYRSTWKDITDACSRHKELVAYLYTKDLMPHNVPAPFKSALSSLSNVHSGRN
jgi:hypothetical protein